MGRNNQQRRKAKAKAKAKAQHGAARQGRAAPRGPVTGAWPGAFGQTWPGFGGGAASSPEREAELSLSWLHRLLRMRAEGRAEEAESAEFEVHAVLAGARATSELVSYLVGRLSGEVEWAWEHGWEPADLLRHVSRALGPGAVELTADLVALSLSRYAAATVSPRWHEQLDSHLARVWWSPETDPLTARLSGAGAAVDVLVDAATLLDLLVQLPALDRVDARPGRWQAPVAPRPEGEPRVTARLLERVRALLAQAESTPYEAEAETFTAAAQSLMARHSIDQALLARSEPAAAPIARRVGVDRPYEAPKASLLDAVAGANRCRTVWSKHLGFSTVVGFEADLRATETLYLSLLVQATHAMTGHGSRATVGGRSRTRSFRQSFLLAYSHRIGQRLRAAVDAEVDQAGASASGGTRARHGPGTDLVAVLADRGREVDDAVEALFPELQERSLGSVNDAEGWAAGTYAAENATLFSGPAVEH
ncbi:MAG: DUF2786 domain-containing protein [Nocardioides sp.]|nr:DUF2786 domain-containing protein [Nocardioides sp.]